MKEKLKSSPALRCGVVVFLIVILFSCGYLTGVLSNININMPLIQKTVATTVAETTTAPTTTAPTTTAPTTTEPTTTEPTTTETTTTTAPTTTQAEDECCLAPLCDFLKSTLSGIFPCLAEGETTGA